MEESFTIYKFTYIHDCYTPLNKVPNLTNTGSYHLSMSFSLYIYIVGVDPYTILVLFQFLNLVTVAAFNI